MFSYDVDAVAASRRPLKNVSETRHFIKAIYHIRFVLPIQVNIVTDNFYTRHHQVFCLIDFYFIVAICKFVLRSKKPDFILLFIIWIVMNRKNSLFLLVGGLSRWRDISVLNCFTWCVTMSYFQKGSFYSPSSFNYNVFTVSLRTVFLLLQYVGGCVQSTGLLPTHHIYFYTDNFIFVGFFLLMWMASEVFIDTKKDKQVYMKKVLVTFVFLFKSMFLVELFYSAVLLYLFVFYFYYTACCPMFCVFYFSQLASVVVAAAGP